MNLLNNVSVFLTANGGLVEDLFLCMEQQSVPPISNIM